MGRHRPGDREDPSHAVILDCDDERARALVAGWDLPPHFATRAFNDEKGCITEKHYFGYMGGLPRLIAMAPGLDLLGNPSGAELWVKCWDFSYEVLTYSDTVPVLPDSVISMHRRAVEDRRRRSAANGDVPVARYLAEGIERGQQSDELWRVACSLARLGHSRSEIEQDLAQIIERSETSPAWPWTRRHFDGFARRALQRYGRPQVMIRPLEMADPGEPAGPGIFVPKEDLLKVITASREVNKRSDLRKPRSPRRLDTVRRVEAKLKAEADAHPRSLDWARAPEGTRDLYQDLGEIAIEALKAGAELAQIDWVNEDGEVSRPALALGGPYREQLEWLLHGNGAPLAEYHGGLILLLSDPESAELPRYPGVPPDTEPKAGKSLGEKLDHLIVLVRSCPGGDQLTQREVATVINSPGFRRDFKLTEYRYVSVSAMSQHHVKLRKAGTIRIIAPAVRYREKHLWHLEKAARYRTGLRFLEGDELAALICHGIAVALERDAGQLRYSLPSSPFDDLFAAGADLTGRECPSA